MTYTQLDNNTGEMKIYGQISEWWNSAEDFTRTFEEMERKYANIHIRIHCYGGSVFEGTVIFNSIANSKSKVTAIVEGIAASMGSIILQACHIRTIAENAFVMIHRPSSFTQGDSQTHFRNGKLLQSMEKNFIRTYARRSGKSEDDVKMYLDGNDHWLSAEEAKAAGMVDEVTVPVTAALPAESKPAGPVDIKSMYDRYAAHMVASTVSIPKTNTNNMKKELIERFGLKGVDENTADAAFVTALGQRFDELTQANQKLVGDQVESVIAAAETVKGQTFDEKTRKILAGIGATSGVEALMVTLGVTAAAPAAPAAPVVTPANTTPRVVNLLQPAASPLTGDPALAAVAARAAWTWDDYQAKDPEALEEMEKSNRTAFVALYKAKYKVDPA